MNKILRMTGVVAAMALFSAYGSAQYYGAIRVMINGQPVMFNEGQPTMINGRVLVPLRGVFENMGAYVHWTEATRTVEATKGPTDVMLRIGDPVATVNGRRVSLDVPPLLIADNTMVPLRFVSEALGADVTWDNPNQTVLITTNGAAAYNPPPVVYNPPTDYNPPPTTYYPGQGSYSTTQTYGMHTALPANTIIPASLDTPLSSSRSAVGDRFSATINGGVNGYYGGIPAGSRVEGHVAYVRPRVGNQPGVLQLQFDQLRLPNGTAVPIDGTIASMDNSSVIRNPDGTLTINPSRAPSSSQTPVYVGLGAGAGVVLAAITHGNTITDALLGGALGYLFGQYQQTNQRASNVSLGRGTQIGVLLNQPLMLP